MSEYTNNLAAMPSSLPSYQSILLPIFPLNFLPHPSEVYISNMIFCGRAFSSITIPTESIRRAAPGVGKTSLVEVICSGEELRRPRSTVDCYNMSIFNDTV
jgi:hypothetical protein